MASNNVIGFFSDKGIQYIPRGSDLLVSCFNKTDHKRGDQNPSLGVDAETGVFHCLSCKVSGSFPQLIGAMGYASEITHYSTYKSSQKVRYDIEFLKNRGSHQDIPGIGRFIEKTKDWTFENNKEYIDSKKTALPDDLRQSSSDIISGEFDVQKRIEFMRRVDSDNVSDLPIPAELYRAKYIDYFSERGLPPRFCEFTEVYLASKNVREIPGLTRGVSDKYFYVPVRGILGGIKSFMAVSFDKEHQPRMYHLGKEDISNPVLDIEKIRQDRDLYVVEGWLDHYKMQIMGYNSFPTLTNTFTNFHYMIANSCQKNVYFVFDQDTAGYKLLLDTLKYVSRTTTNWFAVFLNHTKYKDIGDIDLLNIPTELKASKVYPLYQIKKYRIMLGAEKFNEAKEVLKSDRYTFRSDPIYQEFGTQRDRAGNEDAPGAGPRVWKDLPIKKEREAEPDNPWRLVSVQHPQV